MSLPEIHNRLEAEILQKTCFLEKCLWNGNILGVETFGMEISLFQGNTLFLPGEF
jgi:hypothetical protein